MSVVPDDIISHTHFTTHEARFFIHIDNVEPLSVYSFEIDEGISTLFQIRVQVVSRNDQLDLEQILSQHTSLEIFPIEFGGSRFFNGIVSRVEQGKSIGRFTFYTLTIVPQLYTLTLGKDFRIYQNETVENIIKDVFSRNSIPSDTYEFTLSNPHPERVYCVQFGETDFHFISRLMEEEGIFYYFEHRASSHKLVISDSATVHHPLADGSALEFREESHQSAPVSRFNIARQTVVGGLHIRDFDFKRPVLELVGPANEGEAARCEVYEYPGGFQEPEYGNHLAQIRLEAYQCRARQANGASNHQMLTPGYLFHLAGHDRSEFNIEYLLLSVKHSGKQPQILEEFSNREHGHYGNSFVAIPSLIQYRPRRRHKKPRIQGVQTAIVVGPPGEEIHTDEFGRIKVQFHWDRLGIHDDNSSCWIRVSQSSAGARWGSMFIPRIGQEVIIDFINGDPDNPIVTGCVYHGTNRPPYELPAEKTKSTIKTNSTSGGGGSNEIRFEDKAGEEEIYIHGQKDLDILVENDKTQEIKGSETASIGGDRRKTIHGDQFETVKKNQETSIEGNLTETVSQNKSTTMGLNENKEVIGNKSEKVGGNKSQLVTVNSAETIGAAKELTIGGAYQVSVGGALNETVGASKSEEIVGAKTEIVGAQKTETVKGERKLTVGKKYKLDVAEEISITNGSSSITMTQDGKIEIKGTDLSFSTAAGKIEIDPGGIITIKGAMVKINS